MVIIPKEKPIIENLNIYYLDVRKLLEHYQGEVGSGGIYFEGHTAEGVIFFDKDSSRSREAAKRRSAFGNSFQ